MKNFNELFLFFILYSFLGWILETVFASIRQRRFVNRGFLTGFLCPIYGFGALLVIKASDWVDFYAKDYYKDILASVLFSVILVTALEYITGFILEELFNCKWWDYSHKYANINGYICLEYSLLWGFFAFFLLQVIHPMVSNIVSSIPVEVKGHIVIFVLLYFTWDTIKSVIDALNLKNVTSNYSKFTVKKYYEKIVKYERFFIACPRLMILNAGIINWDIRSILNDKIDKIKVELRNRFQE